MKYLVYSFTALAGIATTVGLAVGSAAAAEAGHVAPAVFLGVAAFLVLGGLIAAGCAFVDGAI